jgi:murein tripeptide amidase MpaA
VQYRVAVASSVTAPDAGASAMTGVIARVLIAYSVQHRPIYAYRMGDPTSALTGVILGQMHGDESAGVTVTDTILHGPPVHGLDLWVIASINPDGYATDRRQNAHGVDLNRRRNSFDQVAPADLDDDRCADSRLDEMATSTQPARCDSEWPLLNRRLFGT